MAKLVKFHFLTEYIPPAIAELNYTKGGPWSLSTLLGQPIWLSYQVLDSSLGVGSWNVSGTSPEQSAADAAAGVAGAEDLDGSPLVYYDKLFPSTLVGDIPSQMAVYQIGAVLMPYNMTALGGVSQNSSTSGVSNGTASQPTAGKGTSKPSGAAGFLAAAIGLIMPLLALTI
ncbi:unnamed protein product [Closterium sp. NIES-64]|nr:unnamed protein product [Closterium sp. NIES-65]CAI5983517.1 unnamed protein product [Closterium sp. NIES-64]